jgi:hypothetical protein
MSTVIFDRYQEKSPGGLLFIKNGSPCCIEINGIYQNNLAVAALISFSDEYP